MVRLQSKLWQTAVLLMISFALIVSMVDDNRTTKPASNNPSSPVKRQASSGEDKFRPRPFVAASEPAVKAFTAQNRTTSAENSEVPSTPKLFVRLDHDDQDLDDETALLDLPLLNFEGQTELESEPTVETDQLVEPEPLDSQIPTPSRLRAISENVIGKTFPPDGLAVDPPSIQPPLNSADSNEFRTERPSVSAPTIQNPAASDQSIGEVGQNPDVFENKQVLIAQAVIDSFSQKVHYGNALARRGAVSSAFAELQGAIKLLAEALDQAQRTQRHSDAVAKAIKALEEASDFATWSKDLSIFVAGHETKILKEFDLSNLSFHEARLAYLGFAEQQLVEGCGKLSISAQAFRSLGKVYLMQEQFTREATLSQAKSMLMFRIATYLNPRDFAATRQLGILYAKYNHFEEAKNLLIKSLQVQSDAATWNNLARVHQELGEMRLARQAFNEARIAQSNPQRSSTVYWTNPSNFGEVGSMVDPPVMVGRQQTNRVNGTASNRNRQNGYRPPNARR